MNHKNLVYMIDKIKAGRAIIEPKDEEINHSLCYLCNSIIDDVPWKLMIDTELSRESYPLDIVCCHSLLCIAGYERNTNVFCSIDRLQHDMDKQYYSKKGIFRFTLNSYNMQRQYQQLTL